jgi:DNA-directed RNA polymerase specialized sigma24 family protein
VGIGCGNRSGTRRLPHCHDLASGVRQGEAHDDVGRASSAQACAARAGLPKGHERPPNKREDSNLPTFEDLVAALPKSRREVLTMLKVNDLSIEEVARATSSTVGAVKQKAHRAYGRLRNLLETAPIVQPTRKRVAQ